MLQVSFFHKKRDKEKGMVRYDRRPAEQQTATSKTDDDDVGARREADPDVR